VRTHADPDYQKENHFVDSHPLNILSLCAGVGGLDLGLGFVEIEAFACEILATRMENKALDEAPIWTDLRTFNCKPWRGVVDCIIGGYPCQPFSVAGKQKGADDPRHLWPSIANIIRDIQPRICFFENVGGHLKLGFEQVHDDLSAMGYQVKTGLFTAAEVGASHKRERLFILAYRESDRINGWLSQLYQIQTTDGGWDASEFTGSGETSLANCSGFICERCLSERGDQQQSQRAVGSVCCELGNTEHVGSSSPTITRGHGKTDGAERSACRTIKAEQSSGTDYVADSHNTGFEEQCRAESICPQYETIECESCLPFPPGPEGYWDNIPSGLKPAICRMADGMANRVDRIRACGNGVVPLAAAYAWHVLTTFKDGK